MLEWSNMIIQLIIMQPRSLHCHSWHSSSPGPCCIKISFCKWALYRWSHLGTLPPDRPSPGAAGQFGWFLIPISTTAIQLKRRLSAYVWVCTRDYTLSCPFRNEAGWLAHWLAGLVLADWAAAKLPGWSFSWLLSQALSPLRKGPLSDVVHLFCLKFNRGAM